jgi:hypothetical protein
MDKLLNASSEHILLLKLNYITEHSEMHLFNLTLTQVSNLACGDPGHKVHGEIPD